MEMESAKNEKHPLVQTKLSWETSLKTESGK
jgi:hypothetical protein